MSTYDVRSNNEEVIDEIVFAEKYCGGSQAFRICQSWTSTHETYIVISDGCDFTIINSKEHALNLIKALNKAIEFGWIE